MIGISALRFSSRSVSSFRNNIGKINRISLHTELRGGFGIGKRADFLTKIPPFLLANYVVLPVKLATASVAASAVSESAAAAKKNDDPQTAASAAESASAVSAAAAAAKKENQYPKAITASVRRSASVISATAVIRCACAVPATAGIIATILCAITAAITVVKS